MLVNGILLCWYLWERLEQFACGDDEVEISRQTCFSCLLSFVNENFANGDILAESLPQLVFVRPYHKIDFHFSRNG